MIRNNMNDKFGIYIHIPFCVRKCNYCDFCSGNYSDEIKEKYVDRLIEEIKDRLSLRRVSVDSIFIGGGTPSILESRELGRILECLYTYIDLEADSEISIECNPGTVNVDKLKDYKSFGINRLSFGLQSAVDEELKVLGRIHTYKEFEESFRLARQVGFDNINVDLMSAIPKQNKETFIYSLEKVKDLNPEHISVYSLIIEEGTPFYDMELDLVDEDEEREMVSLTAQVLLPEFNQYEISNYSKAGYECKHNIKYWTRKPYLGFGIAAASLDGDIRYKNTLDINKYIQSKSYIYDEYENLSLNDQISEYIFLGLRMNKGINVEEFKLLFKTDIFDIFKNVLNKHIESGLLIYENEFLYLSDKGRDLCNYVCSDFIID